MKEENEYRYLHCDQELLPRSKGLSPDLSSCFAEFEKACAAREDESVDSIAVHFFAQYLWPPISRITTSDGKDFK